MFSRREFLASTAFARLPSFAASEEPRSGLVIGQAEAAAAGNAMLAAGGNAIDAAVTAALVAGVVALPSTGIGGYGGHLTLAKPDGTVSAIDFNSAAPAAAKPDMFGADLSGAVKGRVNAHGWLAASVPGVLAGLQLALDRYGTKQFPAVAKPAIDHARKGFVLRRPVVAAIKGARDQFVKDAASARLYHKDGEPLAEGSTFRNVDLAAMLEKLAERGRVDTFYTGDIAEKIAFAFKKNGGLVTAADLAAYRPVEVMPLSFERRGHTLYTPPPTAGGFTVLQTLGVLKSLGWEKRDDPTTTQARVEALRIAWADRLALLGDPNHAGVPVDRLLSKEYAEECAARVRAAVKNGKPVEAKSDGRPAGGTIHLNAVDANGMMVALTFTHGEGFGARVTVEGLGLTLGHGMSRFDPRPGRPNSVAPGKRPLHNMCPMIALKDGKPVLALGATGGRRIPNTVFDVLEYRIGQGRSIAESVNSPRLHTEGDRNLTLEAAWPVAVVDHLKRVGYAVRIGPGATLSAIERDSRTGKLEPAMR